MRTLDDAREVAKVHLAGLGERWAHVLAVGRLAEALLDAGRVDEQVVCAAWLHDVGYSPELLVTGFHPLDGARFLAEHGWPDKVVGLVAHHTGAMQEAVERGLVGELLALPHPSDEQLEEITLIDLSVGPGGSLTMPQARLDEILGRYNPDHPVHAAVERSLARLLDAAERARIRLGLADDWPLVSG